MPTALHSKTNPTFRKLSLGHPLTWLGITLVLLLIGYIWLSYYAGTVFGFRNPLALEQQPVELVNPTQSDTELTVQRQAEMAITRPDDDQRAEEYLAYEAVENKILPLLDSADVRFENGQYIDPPGRNAWQDYLAILQIRPGESSAIAGMTRIKSKLIENAEYAIDSNDLAEAEKWLVQLDQVQPNDPFQQNLRLEINQLIAAEAERKLRQQEQQKRLEKIATALQQANEEQSKTPLNYNNIKGLLDRVIELDANNAEALEGLSRLSDAKLDEVEDALRSELLEQAAAGLKQARGIDATNKRIGSLELALQASQKQQQQLVEQQRLIEQQQEREQAEQDRINQQTAGNTSSTVTSPSTTPPNTTAGTDNQLTPLSPTISKDRSQTNSTQLLDSGIKAYYNGDYTKSFELLYPLAQEGLSRAQFRIGIMYQFGRSVAPNKDIAEKWFTLALPELLREAQLGLAWAQTDLGTAYEFGIGLKKDYQRAAFWYQHAAQQGYPGAQTNLGVLYAQGDGVNYDRNKAIYWLRKAAKQGDQVATENLKILGIKP